MVSARREVEPPEGVPRVEVGNPVLLTLIGLFERVAVLEDLVREGILPVFPDGGSEVRVYAFP